MKTLIKRISIGLAGIAAAGLIMSATQPDRLSWNSSRPSGEAEKIRQVADSPQGVSGPSAGAEPEPSGIIRPPRFEPDLSWNS